MCCRFFNGGTRIVSRGKWRFDKLEDHECGIWVARAQGSTFRVGPNAIAHHHEVPYLFKGVTRPAAFTCCLTQQHVDAWEWSVRHDHSRSPCVHAHDSCSARTIFDHAPRSTDMDRRSRVVSPEVGVERNHVSGSRVVNQSTAATLLASTGSCSRDCETND